MHILASWGAPFKPIAFNTSLIFFILSALLLWNERRPESRKSSLLLFLAGLFTALFCGYVLKTKASFFSLADLFTNNTTLTYPSGQAATMSPLAAIGFIAAGFALIIRGLLRQNRTAQIFSDILAIFIFFWGFVSSVGYLYGLPLLYGGAYVPIALPAAIMFMLLAVALVGGSGPKSILFSLLLAPSLQGRLTRAFLPAVALLLLVMGWIDIKFRFGYFNLNPAMHISIDTIIMLLISFLLITIIARWLGRDLTTAQKTLRIVSSRHEALLSAIPDIIMEVDTAKVYTWANKAGYDFFGGNVIGKEAAHYFEGEQTTYAVVQPLFFGDENVQYLESWQRRKDGQKRLLGWSCRALKDKNGVVTGALSSARDITEIKQAEDTIAMERERLAVTLRS
ncbi:MAG: PAS domain S-box protein, partial [Chitinivibrionales bacterium]|nr:PAS domain S-box protein [Chitinivibrionales bacterium]